MNFVNFSVGSFGLVGFRGMWVFCVEGVFVFGFVLGFGSDGFVEIRNRGNICFLGYFI